jgi:hypothetical protein
MKNLQTLKLGASSIGSAAPRHSRPVAPIEVADEAPATVVETAAVEQQPVVEAVTVVETAIPVVEAAIPVLESQPQPVAVEATPAPASPRSGVSPARMALFALPALGLAAILAGAVLTNAIHGKLLRTGAVVLLIADCAFLVAGAAVAYSSRRPAAAAAAAPARPAARKFSPAKAALLLMMAVGVAAYFGGAGTFAGFTAETSNPNETLASGTLTLQNTVVTSCDSQAGESVNDVNANCNVALTFSNQEPGVYSGTATVSLKNTGSLNASKLYLWAPFSNGVLASAITSGNSATPLTLSASGHGPAGMEGPVAAGDLLVVTYGANSQTFCAGSPAAAGATSITLSSTGACTGYPTTANFNIGQYATVSDQSTDTTAANTNCYDVQQTVYTFNPTTNNPLCSASLLYVQETTGGKNYCWYGNSTGAPTGGCTAPISTTASAGYSSGTVVAGAYTVAALTGNIATNDLINFTQGANQEQCKSSGNYYVGATSITVNTCTLVTGANSGYGGTSVITDATTLGTLASDTTDTISQFDIHKNYNLKQELAPVSANGVLTPTGTDLASAATRTFVVGVIIPGPAAAQNQLQGLKSTFGLTWHIDQ